MTNNLVNEIIDIKINYNTVSKIQNKIYTLILGDEELELKTSGNDWKNLSDFATYEKTLSINANQKISIDANTIEIRGSFNLENIRINGDTDKTKKIKDVISSYFLEGGINLHFHKYVENSKLPEKYIYGSGIVLLNETDGTKLNKFIKSNFTQEIIWILANKPATRNVLSSSVFYIECGTDVNQLTVPAAYLSQISLESEVKPFHFTVLKNIIPTTTKTTIEPNKNYIVLIADKYVVLGDRLENGQNIVNTYILKLLAEKIKYKLLSILLEKPNRFEISGKIHNQLTDILNNFHTIGAINEEVYKKNNITLDYNGVQYIVVKNNELIQRGYKIFIVDVTKSTQSDIEAGNMTPISIILMIQKQVKQIKLNVEVN